jgi:hypothetical protein
VSLPSETTPYRDQHRKWGTIHKRRANGENACGNGRPTHRNVASYYRGITLAQANAHPDAHYCETAACR